MDVLNLPSLKPLGPVSASAVVVFVGAFQVGDFTSTLLMALMIAAGYLPVVSIITEGVVTERVTKLRNVLTVMVSLLWIVPRSNSRFACMIILNA